MLPLHICDVFSWGPSITGIIFFCLEISHVLIHYLVSFVIKLVFASPPPSFPHMLGLVTLAVLLWLLGMSEDESSS